jgi:hypothetical protein
MVFLSIPISIVMVPKNNGIWNTFVDYREINKSKIKDNFPLSFIYQVLDTFSSKNYFSFLDGFMVTIIQIHCDNQDKTTLTCLWRTFSYKVLPFGLCNSLITFERETLSIFFYFIQDKMEIYMDDFTPYGESFDQDLIFLDNVIQRCIEMNLYKSNEKCIMFSEQGIVLGYHISSKGIEFDPLKVKIILDLPSPQK